MAGVKGMKWGARKWRIKVGPKLPSPLQQAMMDGASKQLYAIWNSMQYRCSSPKAENYKNYGGRGIRVCDEWRRGRPDKMGFWNFFKFLGNPAPGMSVDRIDPDGNYEPQNVRWATAKVQARNKRTRQNTFVPMYGPRYREHQAPPPKVT